MNSQQHSALRSHFDLNRFHICFSFVFIAFVLGFVVIVCIFWPPQSLFGALTITAAIIHSHQERERQRTLGASLIFSLRFVHLFRYLTSFTVARVLSCSLIWSVSVAFSVDLFEMFPSSSSCAFSSNSLWRLYIDWLGERERKNEKKKINSDEKCRWWWNMQKTQVQS